ncbi:mycofactocin-coupled SDR family oxidoreductase [Dermacoccaceae bacterium W4C1]
MSEPVVLLAGAGRGIGAATAERLSARGIRVEVWDAFGVQDPLYPLATEQDRLDLADRLPQITTRTVDLRDSAAVDAAAQGLLADSEVVGVVCFAGAVAGGQRLWETDTAQAESLWRSNALTVWNLAHALVPALLHRPACDRASFVAVASTAGQGGLYGLSGYVMAKHACVGVVRALAADLAGTSVSACGVAPGATDTTMLARTAAVYGLPDVGELATGQLTRVPQQPDDVAAVVEFALQAGPVVHGAILPADGGFGRV